MSDSATAASETGAAGAGYWPLLAASWAVATGASLGSLFFSEIMDLPPCSLCWYQRVFMFPLALVLLVGVIRSDKACVAYALPLAIGGLLLAVYHVLLQVGIIPTSAAPCQRGVSCTETQYALFGIISIPVMSLATFATVTTLLITIKRKYLR